MVGRVRAHQVRRKSRSLIAEAHKNDALAAECLQGFFRQRPKTDDAFVRASVGGVLLAEALRELRWIRRLLTPADK